MGVAIPGGGFSEDRASGAQIVDGGLRFGVGYLTRTFGTATNRKIWTWSCWVKRYTFDSTRQTLFRCNSNNENHISIAESAQGNAEGIIIYGATGGPYSVTSAVLRDPSSWYHITLTVDTTISSPSTDRYKIYINGVLQTNYYSRTDPNQNYEGGLNSNALHSIGSNPSGTELWKGSISQVYFIDGQALDPSYFGYTDPLTNVWRPKKLSSSIAFGTNGFYLPFDGSAPIGQDQSGRGNNWTPVNFGGSNTIEKATGALPILNTDGGGKVARVGVRTDANASSLVLALPLVGIKSDFSNAINSGTSNKAITNTGTADASSSYSNFYGGSFYFDGTNDYLETPHNADFTLSRSASCMECWVYPTSLSVQRIVLDKSNSGGSNQSYGLRINTNGTVLMEWIYPGGSAASLTSAGTVQTNTWSHIAVVASGNTLYIYINGVRDANSAALSNDAQSTTSTPFRVGSTYTTSNRFLGYIQDVRVYNNLAKYTTNFYPSKPAGGLPIYNTTDDFGVVKGTGTRTDDFSSSLVLALPMNGADAGTTFTDESANIKGSGVAKTVTVSNTTTSTTQSRFYGSSGSFNGTNSFLSIPASADWSFGTGDVTIEAWAYWDGTYSNTVREIYTNGGSGSAEQFGIIEGSGVFFLSVIGSNSPSQYPPINKWFHIAGTRQNGTVRVFINGQLVLTGTNTNSVGQSGNLAYIGYRSDGNHPWKGYIQDFRLYKGVSKYNSNFTPPIRTDWTPNNLSVAATIPVSSATGALPILNTSDNLAQTLSSGIRSDSLASSLHLCMPLTTAGSRSLADDVSPTGRTIATKTVTLNNVTNSSSGSLFYGNSFSNTATNPSYLGLPDRVIDYSSSFTIECWIYRPSGVGAGIYSDGNGPSGGGLLWLSFSVGSNGVLATYSYPSGTGGGGSLAVPANTWTHIAFVNNSGTINYYVNGVKDSTSHAWAVPGGSTGQYQALYTINSGVKHQDLRMYRTAKYTATFIPPKPTLTLSEQSSADSFVDTPTNYGTDLGLGSEVRGNYATLNPLGLFPIGGGNSPTFSNGNLDISGSNIWARISTIGVSSGKWYAEFLVTGSGDEVIGIVNSSFAPTSNAWIGSNTSGSGNAYGYSDFDGRIYNNGTGTIYGNTFTTNDIIGIALDMDNGRVYFSKNGTWQNSGNPTTQVNPAVTGLTGTWFMGVSNGGGASTSSYSCNFGQRAFAYQAPSGFKSLNTANLPTPTITKPSSVFDVKLYTGTGSTQTITGLNFSPDFAWIKARTAANGVNRPHQVFDTVRGAPAALSPNRTDAEDASGGYDNDGAVTAFTSDGFTVEGQPATGWNTVPYVAWAWDAGSSTVTNTSGSITSSVRANAAAGFSIITAIQPTTANLGCTVGHGLGVAPSMYIVKDRDLSINWGVYHASLSSPATQALQLSTTSAAFTATNYWKSANPTSSVLSVGTSIVAEGNDFVVYAFAPVNSFSAFGSYTGNGSTDGPMVYTGMRPRWLMVKRSDSTGNWTIKDTSRPGYNVTNLNLFANLSNAETTEYPVDILSNGFKVREGTFSDWNANGGTYVYAAFAENPFSLARAR